MSWAPARARRSSAPDSEREVAARRSARVPAVGSIRRSASRPTVDLPQPDSPTSASVSPAVDAEARRRRRRAPRRSACRAASGAPRSAWSRSRARGAARSCHQRLQRRLPAAREMAGADVARAAAPRLRQRASANGQRRRSGSRRSVPARLGTLPAMVASRSRRRADERDRAEQADRVGVLRRGEQACRGRLLDDLAGVHDRHVVAGLGHHAQVVGDEDDGGAGLLAQLGAAGRGSAPGW